MLFFVFPGLEDDLRYSLNINTIHLKVLATTFFTNVSYMSN